MLEVGESTEPGELCGSGRILRDTGKCALSLLIVSPLVAMPAMADGVPDGMPTDPVGDAISSMTPSLSVEGSNVIASGTDFSVSATFGALGPSYMEDDLHYVSYVGIVPYGTSDEAILPGSERVFRGPDSTVSLTAPEDPGGYEIRFFAPDTNNLLAREAIEVIPGDTFADEVIPGDTFADEVIPGDTFADEVIPGDTFTDDEEPADPFAPDIATPETSVPDIPGADIAFDPAIEADAADETDHRIRMPEKIVVGADFEVEISDIADEEVFYHFVSEDTAEDSVPRFARNRRPVDDGATISQTAPATPGTYEVRLHDVDDSALFDRREIEVLDTEIGIDAPSTIRTGEALDVIVEDIVRQYDYLAIAQADRSLDDPIGHRSGTRIGDRRTTRLVAPADPGEFEIRYHLREGPRVVGTAPLTVQDAEIDIHVPSGVVVDDRFDVTLSDVVRDIDYLAIVDTGRDHADTVNHRNGTRIGADPEAVLRAPSEPGSYEVWYHLREGPRVIATTPLEVVAEATELPDEPDGDTVGDANGDPTGTGTGTGTGAATASEDPAPDADDPSTAASAEDLAAMEERLDQLIELVEDGTAAEHESAQAEIADMGQPALAMLQSLVEEGQVDRDTAGDLMLAPEQPSIGAPADPSAAASPDTAAPPAADSAADSAAEESPPGIAQSDMAQSGIAESQTDPSPTPSGETQTTGTGVPAGPMDLSESEAERRIIALVSQLGHAPDDERAAIKAELALFGDPAIDILLEFMQEGLLDRSLALRTVGDIQAQGTATADTEPSPEEAETPSDEQAAADADTPHYRVVNVEADDVLNVRQPAGVSGTIVGTLAPDAEGIVPSGESQDVGGGDWWEILDSSLPDGAGWVNAHFLAPEDESDAAAAADDTRVSTDSGAPSVRSLGERYIEADGFVAQDVDAMEEALSNSLPPPDSAFMPSGQIAPLSKAILLVEAIEGVLPRVRYRLSYGMEIFEPDGGTAPVPISYIQVDRFNLGPIIRQQLEDSTQDIPIGPAEDFGVGPHVSYRLAMHPIRGHMASLMAASRAEPSDTQASSMECLEIGCLEYVSIGNQIDGLRDMDEVHLDVDPPYSTERSGVISPAAAIDMIALQRNVATVSGDRIAWTGFEPRESVAPGEPFVHAVLDVNLGQDMAVDAVLKDGELMDHAVQAVWQRIVSVSQGSDGPPAIFAAEAVEARPGHQ